jgi:uncharacterized protein (TIRG00374 family)
MAAKSGTNLVVSWRSVVYIAALLSACVVIAPQVSSLRDGFARLGDADGIFLGLACLSVIGAIVASGGTYVYLALRPVRFGRTVLVQLAGMFINRLLPAGVGGMGLNARYLYVYKHTLAQAGAVAMMNNVLTGIGHFLLLVGIFALSDIDAPAVHAPNVSISIVVAATLVFLGVVFVFTSRFGWAKRIHTFLVDVAQTLGMYKARPVRFGMALLFAICNTLGHTLALYCCMLAFDVQGSIAVSLAVLTGGIAAASVTPTPGGVVGAEAGLAAGLVGFGVDAPTAVAVAVSYRITSYWFPLIPGALAFFYIQKCRFI